MNTNNSIPHSFNLDKRLNDIANNLKTLLESYKNKPKEEDDISIKNRLSKKILAKTCIPISKRKVTSRIITNAESAPVKITKNTS